MSFPRTAKRMTAKKDPTTEQKRYGFSFPEEPVGFSANPALLCALKAGLVFCATFGALGGILSAFDVDYNMWLVALGMLAFALILAFLHYKAIIFNLAYPALFVIFTFSIIQCRSIANSGFQSFVSILYEAYSDYFDLSVNRTVTITYNDQYTAVTVAALFVGFFLTLLINMAVSNYMSLPDVILVTFPILQIALYIERYPAPVYLFLLLFSYVSVSVLKRSRHYDFPMKKKKRTLFKLRTTGGREHPCRVHSYRANGVILAQTLSLVLTLCALFMALSYVLLINHDSQHKVSNSLKSRTDEYVKIYVQSGFAGFFDRYAARGGISGGRLGGVSSVRPDYQTDLTVTFAPHSYDTLYLKAFTGADYTGNAWLAPALTPEERAQLFRQGEEANYHRFSAAIESRRLACFYTESGKNLHVKIRIENVDADSGYLYLPYFTDEILSEHDIDAGGYNGILPVGETLEVTCYPATETGLLTGSFSRREFLEAVSLEPAPSFPMETTDEENRYLEIQKQLYERQYLGVPENLAPTLASLRREIGTADSMEEQVLMIREYFEEEYPYATNPGTTPLTEDFVEYFLNVQKKGYCAHFASAATLLLRSYGYCARYVEGYVVTFEDMANAHPVDEDYDEFLQGNNPLGKTGVVEAQITDGNAHAWVEVYKEGFGWIPVEFTPPSRETEASYSDFWGIFSGLFSVSDSSTTTTAELAETGTNRLTSLMRGTDFAALPLFVLALLAVLISPAMRLCRRLAAHIRIRRASSRGDYAPMLAYYYAGLLRALAKRGLLPQENPSPREVLSLLLTLRPGEPEAARRARAYIAILERGCFSEKGVTREEALMFKAETKKFTGYVRAGRESRSGRQAP